MCGEVEGVVVFLSVLIPKKRIKMCLNEKNKSRNLM
jgi:hypothetical protein